MTKIFLFGTLRHPPIYEVVAGQPLVGTDARLWGELAVCVKGGNWPMLADVSYRNTEGLLIDVDGEALARLDFYEACFGYFRDPTTVTVKVDGQEVQAQVWRPSDDKPDLDFEWQLWWWAEKWGELGAVAAPEVMRHFGKTDPKLVGRRFWMTRARAQSFLSAEQWRRPNRVGGKHTRADVTIDEMRHPYDAFFTVEEIKARSRRFDGSYSPPQERAVFRVADASTVLPYDPVRDRILLVEQLRFGVLSNGDASPWLLEPVAGMIDPGEDPEQSAIRETREEANLEITRDDLHFVSRFYPSPGGLAQVIHAFVALADLPDDVTGIGGADDEGEDILSHIVPFDVAVEMLETGDMPNAPLVISMQWLILHRDRLRGLG